MNRSCGMLGFTIAFVVISHTFHLLPRLQVGCPPSGVGPVKPTTHPSRSFVFISCCRALPRKQRPMKIRDYVSEAAPCATGLI